MSLLRLIAIAVTGVMATSALPAYAQGAGGQRLGGLFGATRSDTADRNRLNVLFELTQGYDTEIPPEFQAQVPNAGPQSGGYSTLFVTSADFANAGRRWQLGGTAQSAIRYYQQFGDVATPSYSAGIRAQFQPSRTAMLQLSQTAEYSPSYLFQLFPSTQPPGPDGPIVADPEYRARETESLSYRTHLSFSAGSQRGNRFIVNGDYSTTDFRDTDHVIERTGLETYGARVTYRRGVGRSAALSAGVEYRAGDQGLGLFTEHRINLGGEYSRALSGSRRATFRFTLSPSTIGRTEFLLDGREAERVYQLQGEASVDYQFRRTWQASGTYRRGVEYVAVLTQPIFADSARASLSGLVSRRVDVSASAGFAVGESALTFGRSQLDTYTGTARARFALARSFALYTEYFYYVYEQRGLLPLAPGLPRTFEQHGIRAGLTVWVPVF